MKAYELLSSPENWTRGAFARTADDTPLPFSDYHNPTVLPNERPCKFCLVGAIYTTHGSLPNDLHQRTKRYFLSIGQVPPRALSMWNDDPNTTHEDVISLLKALDL
jgi:hypothetical protein